jgi:flagella basal body P-ring formation protein FlgA
MNEMIVMINGNSSPALARKAIFLLCLFALITLHFGSVLQATSLVAGASHPNAHPPATAGGTDKPSFPGVPAPRATVRVNAESTARSDSLTLGDIADVQTNEPQLAMELRAIALGYAPQVGAVREMTKQKIALAISAAGFSQEVVGMEAPAITLIRREAQTVDQALVRQAVERSLVATLHSAGATAGLTRLDLPSNIEVPTGLVEVRASVAAVRTLFSPFPVSIEFWVDGRLFKRLSVTAQAEAFAPVLVAARDLDSKTRLREGDFKVEVRPLVRNSSLYFSEPTRLRGASLVHSLARGEAITTDAVVADIVVKPGDPVRIVGQSGALTILVMGEARAAGRVGDRIQVKNLQSGLLFQAVIVDEGVVSVRF